MACIYFVVLKVWHTCILCGRLNCSSLCHYFCLGFEHWLSRSLTQLSCTFNFVRDSMCKTYAVFLSIWENFRWDIFLHMFWMLLPNARMRENECRCFEPDWAIVSEKYQKHYTIPQAHWVKKSKNSICHILAKKFNGRTIKIHTEDTLVLLHAPFESMHGKHFIYVEISTTTTWQVYTQEVQSMQCAFLL